MRLLSFAIAALPLVLPLGGTLLEFPVDGPADPAKVAAARKMLEVETWDCAKHPTKDPGKVQLPFCSACSQAMTKVEVDGKIDSEAERYLRLDVADQRLRIVSGPWTGIGMLRESTIEKALEDTGASLRKTGWQMRGHVLLEVEAKKAEDTDGDETKAKAKTEAKTTANGKSLAKALAAFGKVEAGAKGELVLVRFTEQKDGYDRAALVAAVEDAGYTVKDLLWIVNQCSGELVMVAR